MAYYTVWGCSDVSEKGDTSFLLFRRNAGTNICVGSSVYTAHIFGKFLSHHTLLTQRAGCTRPLQGVVTVWSPFRGYMNIQNSRVPVLVHEVTLCDVMANVRCAISAASNIGPRDLQFTPVFCTQPDTTFESLSKGENPRSFSREVQQLTEFLKVFSYTVSLIFNLITALYISFN